ncbi:MAG: CRISPR-associated primase-polymerase type A1 [Thermodesulfobacteriota bacterium]
MSISKSPQAILDSLRLSPHDPALHLALARAYFEQGDEEKAREIVLRRRQMPTTDAAVPLGWAELCAELGLAHQARESYLMALRLYPENVAAMFGLAQFSADVGQTEDAVHYLKKILSRHPEHQPARALLAETYQDLGLVGQAEVLSPSTKKVEEPVLVRYFPPSVSEEEKQTLCDLFAGRETGYARQEIDNRTGRIIYRPVDRPLGPDQVAAHLNGDQTLGFFPLRWDKTVRLTGVSVRLASRTLEANLKNHGYLTFLKERSKDHLLSIAQWLAGTGIKTYAEDTGEFKYRLWIFFEEWIHFLKVKAFIQDCLERFPPPPEGHIIVEPVLPTQSEGLGWMEQPISLPLGIHRGTLRRSLFLDAQGNPVPNQLKYLSTIRLISFHDSNRIIHRTQTRPLFAEKAHLASRAPFQTLWEQCRVIRKIGEKALAGRVLRSEEKAILFYSVGLLDQGEDLLHYLMENGPTYHFRKVRDQVRRLKPHPVSCLKIRQWVPELIEAVPCHCSFDLRGGKYPSPLLHVNPHSVPSSNDIAFLEKLSLKETALRYVRLRDEMEDIDRMRLKLEEILEREFGKKQIERLPIGDKVLFCRKKEGRIFWEIGYE